MGSLLSYGWKLYQIVLMFSFSFASCFVLTPGKPPKTWCRYKVSLSMILNEAGLSVSTAIFFYFEFAFWLSSSSPPFSEPKLWVACFTTYCLGSLSFLFISANSSLFGSLSYNSMSSILPCRSMIFCFSIITRWFASIITSKELNWTQGASNSLS